MTTRNRGNSKFLACLACGAMGIAGMGCSGADGRVDWELTGETFNAFAAGTALVTSAATPLVETVGDYRNTKREIDKAERIAKRDQMLEAIKTLKK